MVISDSLGGGVTNQKQISFLHAMLTEANITKAAESAHISRTTAGKYMQDPEFRAELTRQREQLISDAAQYIKSKLGLCAEKLLEIVEDIDAAPQVRINAIAQVFSAFKSLNEVEVMSRLSQIEAALEKLEDSQ